MKKRCSVVVVGDVMQHAIQHQIPRIVVSDDVKQFILSSDVRICNLETPITDRPESGFPKFSTRESFLNIVSSLFNVAVISNNHSLDQGVDGLIQTYNRCRAAGLYTVGFGNSTVDFVCGSTRLNIVAMTKISNVDASSVDILSQTMPHTVKGAVNILYAHSGKEYSKNLTTEQREILSDDNWAASFCVHSHVIGSTNRVVDRMYGRRYISNGLGNFISEQKKLPVQLGLCVKLIYEGLELVDVKTMTTQCSIRNVNNEIQQSVMKI